MRLNLNADLGESFGPWPMGDDDNLLQIVDTANVACGFHAGDPLVLKTTISSAMGHGVSVGAHPGFPDLQGFGRRPMQMPADELKALIQYQLAVMDGLCRMQQGAMKHVKPHGALNNMACEDAQLASVVAHAIAEYDATLPLLAPALSELARAGEQCGLTVAVEIFADRAYEDDGSLVSRRKPGAVLASSEACIEHIRRMIDCGGIVTSEGKVLATEFHSICVHGDNAHATETARRLRDALLEDGHELMALDRLLNQALA